MFIGVGSENSQLSAQAIRDLLYRALDSCKDRKSVLTIPPDFTRFHSAAGQLTGMVHDYFGLRLTRVLPATGTHAPMSDQEIATMYGSVPRTLFQHHTWRSGLATLGEVPASFIHEQSEGRLKFSWPVQVNRHLIEGGFDLILSIGQVVPHEVAGMANQNKNILIGVGGPESIHRSHYLGAVYGIERIMGRADNPVRRVLNRAAACFLQNVPIVYALTVRGKDEEGNLVTRGLFIGDDNECFERAAELSLKVNFAMLDRPIKKAVVYLNPSEFKSTWLGNKAIYRTRLALADGAELVVIAPGIKSFGEDADIDRLIRKHGYVTTPEVLQAVESDTALAENLSAAAHLIHGSSEERFRITYCPGHLTREEIEGVNYSYCSVADALKKYDPEKLRDGYNDVSGEEIFYISNPALGLWAHKNRF
jgi:nickel-dependent lactate racemase